MKVANIKLLEEREKLERVQYEANASIRKRLVTMFDSAGFEISAISFEERNVKGGDWISGKRIPHKELEIRVVSLPFQPGEKPAGWPI